MTRTERGKKLEALSQKLLAVLKEEESMGSTQEDYTFAMQALIGSTLVLTMSGYKVKSQKEFLRIYNDNVRKVISVMSPMH